MTGYQRAILAHVRGIAPAEWTTTDRRELAAASRLVAAGLLTESVRQETVRHATGSLTMSRSYFTIASNAPGKG